MSLIHQWRLSLGKSIVQHAEFRKTVGNRASPTAWRIPSSTVTASQQEEGLQLSSAPISVDPVSKVCGVSSHRDRLLIWHAYLSYWLQSKDWWKDTHLKASCLWVYTQIHLQPQKKKRHLQVMFSDYHISLIQPETFFFQFGNWPPRISFFYFSFVICVFKFRKRLLQRVKSTTVPFNWWDIILIRHVVFRKWAYLRFMSTAKQRSMKDNHFFWTYAWMFTCEGACVCIGIIVYEDRRRNTTHFLWGRSFISPEFTN